MALSPDETKLLVANYYSGAVAMLDAQRGELLGNIALGRQLEPDAVRRGEMIFHDARHAFQRWHSCASCHPNQGRVDALRWDFLRDGIGNAKDTPSLVLVNETAPLNRRATRKDARECAHTGLLVSHMIAPTESVIDDLLAFLVSLRPQPSPHLTKEGRLTAAAQRGRALFHGKAQCAGCHPAPFFTDRKMHNVGVLTHNEPDGRYDTPSLIEVHRTSPYLHDGRAMTLKQVFTAHNEQRRHGNTHKLSATELDDLVAFLRSL
jgi:cytochrome c peroxidase